MKDRLLSMTVVACCMAIFMFPVMFIRHQKDHEELYRHILQMQKSVIMLEKIELDRVHEQQRMLHSIQPMPPFLDHTNFYWATNINLNATAEGR